MQPPVGQLPTLCIPASESSSPCWYAMCGVLIPVTMIGAPAARSADLPATTLYVRHRLHLTFALVPLHTHTQRAASAPRLTVQCTHSMLRFPPAQPGALVTVVPSLITRPSTVQHLSPAPPPRGPRTRSHRPGRCVRTVASCCRVMPLDRTQVTFQATTVGGEDFA